MLIATRPCVVACGCRMPELGPGCSASPIRRARKPYLADVLGELPIRSLRLRFRLVRLLRLR
eukprot:11197105-Heterocapsa_arctica.AAC.1